MADKKVFPFLVKIYFCTKHMWIVYMRNKNISSYDGCDKPKLMETSTLKSLEKILAKSIKIKVGIDYSFR